MYCLFKLIGCILLLMLMSTAYAVHGTLELPKNTLRIENEAFSELGNITEIVLPDGLEYIGSKAFAGSGLVKLTIPDSVTTIEPDAFEGVSSEAVIQVSRGSYADFFFQMYPPAFTVSTFSECTPWEYIDLRASKGEEGLIITIYGLKDKAYDANGETVFTDLAFSDKYLDQPIESIIIKESAFENNTALKGSLILPDCVTSIESYAFCGCANLTGVLDLPDSLTEISYAAFADCSGFTGLSLPRNLTCIDIYAFDHCTGLSGTLNLPESLVEIGMCAFTGCSSFTGDLILPEGLTHVDGYAFSNCTGFNGILSVPGTLTTMGERAFGGCSGFSGLVLGEGLTTLGSHAFSDCTGMRDRLILPSTLSAIPDGAFSNCGFEGSLVFPASLTSIGYDAFRGCTGFTGSLHLNRITYVDIFAFKDCAGFSGKLNLGKVKTLANSCFEGCSGFTGILNIPNTVENIGSNSFYGCSGFTRLVCANADALDDGSFSGLTGITSAVIDGRAEKVYQRLFKDCTSLRTVDMDLSKGTSISDSAFENCVSLLSFDIPEPVSTIGQYAFKNCESLSGIMILPDSVKYIYKGAFENCISLSGISIMDGYNIHDTAFSGLSPDFTFFSSSSTIQRKADKLGIPCYSNRITKDISGNGLPSGTLYQGDSCQIRMYLTGDTIFSEISAEIIDANGIAVQKASATVTSMPCSVNALLGHKLCFEKLSTGTYTFVLRAKSGEQAVVLGTSSFEVISAPVRAQIKGLDVLRNGVIPSKGALFEGSMTCNYPIDRLTATLTDEKHAAYVQLHEASPGSSAYDFSALNEDISLEGLTPLNEYRFTLKITIGNTTVNLLNTTFIVSDSGKTYTTAELEAIGEFVSNWENANIFSKFNDGNEYIKGMGFIDGAQLVFQSALHPSAALMNLAYLGEDHFGYMTDCYTQQLLAVLSEVDQTLDLTESIEDPWYAEATDELLKYGKIINTTAKDLTDYDKYFKTFSSYVDEIISSISSADHIREWSTQAINDVSLVMRNFENSIRILDIYKDTAEYEGNPAYRTAVNRLALKFSQQADSALVEFLKLFADMSMEEITDMGINFVYQLITMEDGLSAYSIVTFALKEFSSIMGWDESASGKVELTTQQAIFSNAVYYYVQTFEKVARGDTSAEAISQLELWLRTAISSGSKTYDSLLKIYKSDIFNSVIDDETQRLTRLQGELEMLIYSTPFA